MQINSVTPMKTPERSHGRKVSKKNIVFRWGILVVGIISALALVLYFASFAFDEPLRSITENKINQNLRGYSVRLSGVHLQLIGLSVNVKGLTMLQQAYPNPPIVFISVLKATIAWREILSGRLVADIMLDQPQININLQQLRNEVADTVPLKEHGWQEAVASIYPLKINTVKIYDANAIYTDQDPNRPLVLSHLNLQITNIRNIQHSDRTYPSTFHLDTVIFGTGYGSIDGDVNFFSEPHSGIKANFKLEKIPIDYFKPVLARSNLSIHDGVLEASGYAEYAPNVKIAHLENLTVQGMKIDYIHSPRTAVAEKKRAVVVEKTANELSNKPGTLIRADQLNMTGCTFGMVNEAASKRYRVFLADTEFKLSNFSNQFSQGPAQAHLKGKFMGSGITTATVNFRPEEKGPDFDLNVKIESTQLTAMNDLLRAYGNFDVLGGIFSLSSQVHIKNNAITGYIKPLFKDMKVYDRRKDKERSAFHQLYEMLIGGVAKLLENKSGHEVAIKANLTGPVGQSENSTWQIVVDLIKNAFFKAILPSFEKEVNGSGKP